MTGINTTSMTGFQTHRRPFFSRTSAAGGLACLLFLASCMNGAAENAAGKPNIVFIMADDLGYADLSSYGRRDYRTPHIDKLAAEGLKFTSAYANSPVCSATRTALMTGHYQYRYPIGLEEPLAIRHIGLEPGLPTLASELKRLGYQTSLVGKWHLGPLPDYGPLQSGYDHFYGFRGGGVDYHSHSVAAQHDLWDGDAAVEETGYLTDLLGDRAVRQIEEFAQTDTPFLLNLHFSAPHWPWQLDDAKGRAESARIGANPNPLAIFHYDGGDVATYAGMVTRLDDQVGRVIATLERLGLDENTIVVFTSDNGGERFSDNWPFTGRKSEVLEGGIRVPAILRWPGTVESGSASDAPIMTMDWLPTFLSVAGDDELDASAFDGVSLLGHLNGEAIPERPLYWRYNLHDQKAVRLGRWKYLQIAGNEFLFDLMDDPMERANLKIRRPELFAELKARYEAWNSRMLPYDDTNFSAGFSGADLADHYGVTQSANMSLMPPE